MTTRLARRRAVSLALAACAALALSTAGCTRGDAGSDVDTTHLAAVAPPLPNPSPIVTAGDLTVRDAVAPAPAGDAPMALYFTVVNAGTLPDTLLSVASDDAGDAMLHEPRNGNAMAPAGWLAVPAGGTLRLRPGGTHAMLDQLRRPIVAGETVQVMLVFRRAGMVPVAAPVVSYAALERRFERADSAPAAVAPRRP